MSTKRFLIVASLLAAAMLTMAVAQKTSNAMHARGMGEMGFGDHTGYLASQLGLNDQQKQSVQNIFAAEKPKMQPLLEDLGNAHKQVQEAIDNGTLDQNQALNIIEAHKTQLAQLLAEHALVHSEIMKVLTPDQQAKFKSLQSEHHMHMHHGMGMGMGSNQNQSPAPDQSH